MTYKHIISKGLSFLILAFIFISSSSQLFSQNFHAEASSDVTEVCGSADVQLHSFLSVSTFEDPDPISKLEQIKVIVHFDQIPENYQVSIAPLKYDKLFAMAGQFDSEESRDLFT
ncbi:MAG: hypothetical protein JEZ03_17970, partial [Bacteroidales bacterium]|nr:hypothetical protein [Bacteroidales bacterium]